MIEGKNLPVTEETDKFTVSPVEKETKLREQETKVRKTDTYSRQMETNMR